MKVSSPSLLNINVDTLFEQNSISEIDQIYKKLQNDVEEKKEELRTMVGERYRDLLKAADTIGDMKKTAESVTTHVEGIMTSCRNLNEHQLIGFKTESLHSKPMDKTISKFYGVAVQIKILTQLPELIWSRIDNEDFFVATQLFIFARHISTGLQLDINDSMMKSFPVANKLWAVLSPFFYTIKQACITTLAREHLTGEIASKCLASILLLENCQMEKLLKIFIQLRAKAFKATLFEDTEQHQRVKEKILTSLRVLTNTIDLIYKCFVDNEDTTGLLMKELINLSAVDAPATICLIDSENPLMTSTLPDIIAKFKPHVQISELKPESLQKSMQSWLQYMANDSKQQLTSLIGVIASIKTIHYIKSDALALEKPTNWSAILQQLFLPSNLDLYQFYYQPLIVKRIKDIIETSWKNTIKQTQNEVDALLKSEHKNVTKGNKSSIWTENSSDIPLSLKQALSTDKQYHKLLLKTKGYSLGIINVCDSLDKKLKTLFVDLNLYLSHENEGKENDMEKRDLEDIKTYLKESSREGVSELITNIKSTKFEQTQSNLILLATILQSIMELCPHLKQCLFHNISSNWDQLSSSSNLEQWESVYRLLEEESLRIWNTWIELFIKELLNDGCCFKGGVDLVFLLKEFSNWETITIEEKDEHDNPIQSIIRIPAQPSISLQVFLNKICSNLNKTVPHTLPKAVANILANKIAIALHATYSQLVENDFIKSNQNASLQYFFDVKFITIMFVTRENKKTNDCLQTLATKFKSIIDPFDFELFHKYVNINVKKSAQRMQHKLGSIISNIDYLSTVLGNQPSLMLQEKDPNVLVLSSTSSGWFPMLPVISATQKSTTSNKFVIDNSEKSTKSKKQQQTNQTSNSQATTQLTSSQNYANVKSGAAAFFGAMSQDWFR